MNKSDTTIALGLVFLSSVVYVLLLLFAATGLRGSDQYWYTAEIEQMLKGIYDYGTVAFPYHAYHGLIPPPFNHHTLTHYAVLPFAKLFGAYAGWIVFNAIATTATAALIAILTTKMCGVREGALAYSVTLLLPLVFWISAQPYMESSLAPFVALGLLLYVVLENSFRKWFLLLLVFAAAYMCRTSFLAILLLVPIGCLLHSHPKSRSTLTASAMLLVLVVATIFAYKHVFQPDPALTLSRYLNAKVPGVSDNMHVLYALDDEPIEAGKVLRKAFAGFQEQFVKGPLTVQIFYLPFNCMVLLSGLLLFRKRFSVPTRAAIGVFIVLGLHGLTIALRGNEFRFLHVAMPALIFGSILSAKHFDVFASRKRWFSIALLFIIGSSAVNFQLARRMRTEASKELKVRRQITEIFDEHVPADAAIMLGLRSFSEKNLLFGYAVNPRLVLFMRSSFGYSAEQIERMRSNTKAEWLFAEENSPLVDTLSVEVWRPVTAGFPKPFRNYKLFKLERPYVRSS